MKKLLSLLVVLALAAPIIGCQAEARVDAEDDDRGRRVGQRHHDRDDDVSIKGRVDVD